MKFRKEQVDKIMILEDLYKEELESKIEKVAKKNVIIDLQYGVVYTALGILYSVLILLRKKD